MSELSTSDAMRLRLGRRLGLVMLAAAAAAGACAQAGGPAGSLPAPAGNCRLGGDAVPDSMIAPPPAPDGPATISIALPDTVDVAHAPLPSNDSERQLFVHMYEGLVRIDCDGEPQPALARSWKAEDGGSRWGFAVREDARWWDGSTVTAREVAAGLTDAIAAGNRGRAARWPIASIQVTGERTLAIEMTEPVALPLLFADPALAVRRTGDRSADRAGVGGRTSGGFGWPIGTGRYRPDAAALPADGSGAWTTLKLIAAAGASVDLPSLDFRILAGRDARNALDGGVDLLVTRDPTTIAYATRLPAYRSEPLPWTRTYALVSPALARDASADTVAEVPIEAAAALARDAVTGEARGSMPPYGWLEKRCTLDGGERVDGPPRPLPRIVYRAGDPTGRLLAERLVALSRDRRAEADWLRTALPAGTDGALVAAGLGRDAFATALRRGGDAGYIIAIDRVRAADCGATRGLLEAMPWARLHGTGPAILPLVDTRATAIARRGVPGLKVDGTGTVFIDGPVTGRPAGRAP